MRTSSSPGHEIDVLEEVHDRDTVLVPYGWHGPCVAAPGFDMYYLNVMAGPRRRARLEDLRPPRPGLGARHLGDQDVDPRLTFDGPFRRLDVMPDTIHLTVAQAW